MLVTLGVAFVNHLAMPWSMRLLREYIVQVRTDILTQVIQPGQFSSPESGLTFHIRERALNGELLGLIVHDTRDKAQSQSYLAERGVIVKREPSNYLVMTDGHIVRRTDKDEPAQIVAFDKYAVDLDRFEKKIDGGRRPEAARALPERAPAPREGQPAVTSRSRASSAPSCMSARRTRSTPSPSRSSRSPPWGRRVQPAKTASSRSPWPSCSPPRCGSGASRSTTSSSLNAQRRAAALRAAARRHFGLGRGSSSATGAR